jgi:hypothetical protein
LLSENLLFRLVIRWKNKPSEQVRLLLCLVLINDVLLRPSVRFVKDQFFEFHEATIGAAFMAKTVYSMHKVRKMAVLLSPVRLMLRVIISPFSFLVCSSASWSFGSKHCFFCLFLKNSDP